MRQTFTRVQAARLTGCSEAILKFLVSRRAIPSSGNLNTVQMMVLAVGRGLRRYGLTYEAAARALSFLWSQSRERIEADLDRGAGWLALIAGRIVIPRLVSKDEILTDPVVRAAVEFDGRLAPAWVDVGLVWQRLVAAVERLSEPYQAAGGTRG